MKLSQQITGIIIGVAATFVIGAAALYGYNRLYNTGESYDPTSARWDYAVEDETFVRARDFVLNDWGPSRVRGYCAGYLLALNKPGEASSMQTFNDDLKLLEEGRLQFNSTYAINPPVARSYGKRACELVRQ